jgi:cell division protein FtsL
MMRFLNICVIAALVLAAADVYNIKFESTRQAQRVAKLRLEIRREHDVIAALRAEWAKLDSPARIQQLARRHLALKPVDARQFDRFDNLPRRPPELVPVGEPDPIGAVIANPDLIDRMPTASLPPVLGRSPQVNANPPVARR